MSTLWLHLTFPQTNENTHLIRSTVSNLSALAVIEAIAAEEKRAQLRNLYTEIEMKHKKLAEERVHFLRLQPAMAR